MEDGVMLKYGRINEPAAGANLVTVEMVASMTVSAASGRFVFMVAGAATLCKSDSATIFGVLNTHAHDPDTGEKIGCDIDLTGIWRIPVNAGTYAIGMVGDVCDLGIDGNDIQGALLDASTHDIITIVGGDLVNNNWVDVVMTPREWNTSTGVE